MVKTLGIGLFGSKSKHVEVLSISLFLAGLFFASLGQLVEELEGIRITLVQEKSGGKVKMVVEEMG